MAGMFRPSEGKHRRNAEASKERTRRTPSSGRSAIPHGHEQKPRPHPHSMWVLTLIAGDITAGVLSDVFIRCLPGIHKGRGTVTNFDVAYGQKGEDAVTNIRRASLCSPCSGLAAGTVSRETCAVPSPPLRRKCAIWAVPRHFARRPVKDAPTSL
jgi:hypothetical protein